MIVLRHAPDRIQRCVDSRFVVRRAETLMKALNLEQWKLSIWLVDDKQIQGLNRRHRGKNRPTDILSFPKHKMIHTPGILPPSPSKHLGQLVISIPFVERYCEKDAIDFDAQMPILLAHGICHLLGYDHKNDMDYLIMKEEESRILHLSREIDP